MVTANFLAFTVSITSLIIEIILSAIIIGYNYRLKRFMNIFLGASPALAEFFFSNDNFLILRLILIGMLMLLYVFAISSLSRMEIGVTAHLKWTIIGSFIIIFSIISIIAVARFFSIFQGDLVPSLVLFSGIIVITFKQTLYQGYSSRGIQEAITTLVLSIIILDSIFVSGAASIYYGLDTLLLIIPSMALARKLYVT